MILLTPLTLCVCLNSVVASVASGQPVHWPVGMHECNEADLICSDSDVA